jgi:hypothetical protein
MRVIDLIRKFAGLLGAPTPMAGIIEGVESELLMPRSASFVAHVC